MCRSRIHLPASLRSRPVTTLHGYYERSDSPTALAWPVWVSLIHCAWPSRPSASNHLCTSVVVFTRYPSTLRTSRGCGSGLRHWLAGSPVAPAETSFYRADERFTSRCSSPRPLDEGDAITFGFRPESVCRRGTCTLLTKRPFRRTSAATCRRFVLRSR